MQKLNVEVFEEKGRPEGGHAVVRLAGLKSLPDDVSFRIRPVDSAQLGDQRSGWAEREYKPIATRLTEHGAELVIGPEIVENPAFLPGTLTVIELQRAGARGELIRGEFLWPRIAPLLRPKRRHLRLAKPIQETPPAPIAFEEAIDASAGTAARLAPVIELATVKAEASATGKLEGLRAAPIEGAGGRIGDTAPGVGQAAVPPLSGLAGESDPFAELRRASAADADVTWSRKPAAGSIGGARFGWSHVAAGVVAGAATGWLLVSLMPQRAPRVAVQPAATNSASVATATDNAGSLADVLAVGARSPRGRDVAQVATPTLLQAADAHLHGPPDLRDEQEASFLLRRYLAATLSEGRTLWALTQLGSSYAEPASAVPPDYARARQLWEISATLGDPVAMCFLGALHEHGLGAPADRSQALQWFIKAKQAGGCPQVDESIARMSKVAP